MDATSIKQLIQQLVRPQLPELAEGIVTNTDPLEITLVNDVKIILHSVLPYHSRTLTAIASWGALLSPYVPGRQHELPTGQSVKKEV